MWLAMMQTTCGVSCCAEVLWGVQDESDQALAAYRTAARLFPGLHQPVLGMGREYQHMNNYMLAEQMYLQVCSSRVCACWTWEDEAPLSNLQYLGNLLRIIP